MAWSTKSSRVRVRVKAGTSKMVDKPKLASCSFCGKSQNQVGHLIAGPGTLHICDECVGLCQTVLQRESAGAAPHPGFSFDEMLKPVEIKNRLDDYVIGQEHAKKVLSVAVHNHYKRMFQHEVQTGREHEGVEIEKSNIMLIGPTGSGKTLLARTLARILDVPFSIADATTLTEAGYVGEDTENILLHLIQAADFDVARAQRGIIYVDEIDKIGRRTENVSITRDVSGEGVQQALLKILEGTVASVSPHGGRKHPQQEYIKIDTSNILFILGGAFVGLESIVERRRGRSPLGFLQEKALEEQPLPTTIEPEDLVHYGLIPEFVGRVPVVSTLNQLTRDDLVRILVEPRNAMVKQYQKLMAMEGVKLEFTQGALEELADTAVLKKTGARGLRSILENMMLDAMYEAPERGDVSECRITKSMVQGRRGLFPARKKKSA